MGDLDRRHGVRKDLGTSLLLYASFLVVVYLATQRFSWVVLGLLLFAAGSVVAYFLFSHVRVRVQTWLDPFADPEGTGYQMVQSLFSFATGGIFGTGLGNGQPDTVPAASTDFIIAAFGEELGLVGLASILMLYTIVIVRGMRTAIATRTTSASCWPPVWPRPWPSSCSSWWAGSPGSSR